MVASAVVVGGVGLAGQAYFGNRAARSQAKNARTAQALYQENLNSALGRLEDYEATGREALSPLSALVLGKQFNPETGDFDPVSEQQRMNLFQKSPGYQFRLDQGKQALERSQSARGGLLGGRALKELEQYSQGIASDEYGNYIGQLQGLYSSGQTASTNAAQIQAGGGGALANLQLAQNPGQQYQNYSNMFGSAAQAATFIGGNIAGKSAGGGNTTLPGGNGAYQLQSPTYELSGRYS